MTLNNRPNLFVIGSMKSGTSSLHYYLNAHPEIHMSKEKEPGYFLDEFTRSQGEMWYLSLFQGARDAKFIGESSTHYTKLPRFQGAPSRIAEFAPNARLIYIMRDPIERTLSHYWHMVMIHDERRDIMTAIDQQPLYTSVSYYAMQLRPYLELFSREQLYTLTFEELISSPMKAMQQLFKWLTVDPTFEPFNITRPYNVTPTRFEKSRVDALNQFRRSGLWNLLSPLFPDWVKPYGRRLAVRQYNPKQQNREMIVRYLRPRFQEQTDELTGLFGRSFPEWKTLYSE